MLRVPPLKSEYIYICIFFFGQKKISHFFLMYIWDFLRFFRIFQFFDHFWQFLDFWGFSMDFLDFCQIFFDFFLFFLDLFFLFFGIFWIFCFFWIFFWIFLFFWFLSKLIRLLLYVTMVTTGHQKSPKIGQNSIKSRRPKPSAGARSRPA